MWCWVVTWVVLKKESFSRRFFYSVIVFHHQNSWNSDMVFGCWCSSLKPSVGPTLWKVSGATATFESLISPEKHHRLKTGLLLPLNTFQISFVVVAPLAVPVSHISLDWKTKLPGFLPLSSPLLFSLRSFSSRPICQQASPSHHYAWQANYLGVVTHSGASLQPSSPAGGDTPCNRAVTLWMKRGPMFPAMCEARGGESFYRYFHRLASQVATAVAVCAQKVDFKSCDEVWP